MIRRIWSIGCQTFGRTIPFSRNVRFFTPDQKYVDIFKSDFTAGSYPVDLLGGTQVEFAKLLFTIAEKCENKNYKTFIGEFSKLDKIAKEVGPFWGEANFFEAPQFKDLNPGFKFVIAWMQSEGAIDLVPYVKSSYKELANEANKECTAIVTVPQDPAKMGDQLAAIKKEVEDIHAKSTMKNYKLEFEFQVDPTIKGGYIFEVCNEVVDKSAAATAGTAALEKAASSAVDWTAVPPAAPRPSAVPAEVLVRLLGSIVDDLADADKAELKYGA